MIKCARNVFHQESEQIIDEKGRKTTLAMLANRIVEATGIHKTNAHWRIKNWPPSKWFLPASGRGRFGKRAHIDASDLDRRKAEIAARLEAERDAEPE